MNINNIRKIISLIILAALAVFLAKYSYDHHAELANIFRDMEFEWLGPVLLVALIINLISALLWVCLLRKMNCDLPWAWLVAVWFQSLAGKYVPGSIWMIVGRIYQLRKAGVSLRVGGYSSGLEQIVVLASGAFVALLTPEVMMVLGLPGWSGWLFLPFALVILFPDFLGQIIWKAGIRRFDLRMERPPTPKFMILYFVGHVARVVLTGIVMLLILKLFHTDPSGLTWFNLPGIASAAFVVGYMSLLTPGGVGVKEGILVLLLNQYIPFPVALSVAVSGRLWSFLADISGVAAASLYISLTKGGEPR